MNESNGLTREPLEINADITYDEMQLKIVDSHVKKLNFPFQGFMERSW